MEQGFPSSIFLFIYPIFIPPPFLLLRGLLKGLPILSCVNNCLANLVVLFLQLSL